MPVQRLNFPRTEDTWEPPAALAKDRGELLKNFLPGRAGRGFLRNRLRAHHDGELTTEDSDIYVWTWDNDLLVVTTPHSGAAASTSRSEGEPGSPASVTIDPSSNGAFWTANNSYTAVDDGATADDDATFTAIEYNEVATVYFPNLTDVQVPDDAIIDSVVISARSRQASTGVQSQRFLMYGIITPYTGPSAIPSVTTTYDDRSWTLTTDPHTGEAWTVDTLRNWTSGGSDLRSFGLQATVNGEPAVRLTRLRATINYSLPSGWQSEASTAVPASRAPSARLGDYTYGIGNSAAPKIVQWDGGTSFLELTNGPREPNAVKAYLNRLFVLAGSEPGTTTPVYGNRLFWSDDGGPTADTTAMWQDDASNLTNQIVFDTSPADAGEPDGTALAAIDGALVIFTANRLYVMRGSSPANFVVKPIANLGVTSPRAVVEHNQGVYFVTTTGRVIYFDGTDLRDIGKPIQRFLDGTDTSMVTFTRVDDNHLLLVDSNHENQDRHCWLYYIPGDDWSQVESSATAREKPLDLVKTRDWTLIWDGRRFWRAEDIAQEGDGVDAVDESAGTTTYMTTAEAYTRLERLAQPLQNAFIRRAMVEYEYQYADRTDPTTDGYTGWEIELVDGSGTTIYGPETVEAAGSGTTDGLQRAYWDVHREAADVQAIIRSPSQGDQLDRAEIHAVYVDYEPTHETHG